MSTLTKRILKTVITMLLVFITLFHSSVGSLANEQAYIDDVGGTQSTASGSSSEAQLISSFIGTSGSGTNPTSTTQENGLIQFGACILWDIDIVDLREYGATDDSNLIAAIDNYLTSTLSDPGKSGAVWRGTGGKHVTYFAAYTDGGRGVRAWKGNPTYGGAGTDINGKDVEFTSQLFTNRLGSMEHFLGDDIWNYVELLHYIDSSFVPIGVMPDNFYTNDRGEWCVRMDCAPIIRFTIVPYAKNVHTGFNIYYPNNWQGYDSAWFRPFGTNVDDFRSALFVTRDGCNCGRVLRAASAMFGVHNCKLGSSRDGWHFDNLDYIGLGRTSFIDTSAGRFWCRGYIAPFSAGALPGSSAGSAYQFCVSAIPTNDTAEFPSTRSDTFTVYISATGDTLNKVQEIAKATPDAKFTVTISVANTVSTVNNSKVGGPASYNVTAAASASGTEIKKEYTATQFLELLSSGKIDWAWSAVLGDAAMEARHGLQFTVKVQNPVNTLGLNYSSPIIATAVESNKISRAKDDSKWDPASKTDFASWGGMSYTSSCIPYTCEIGKDQNVYAEIVANAAAGITADDMAPDWNVSEGIPTTENISIAIGGEAFSGSFGGNIHAFGISYGSVNNSEIGSNQGGAITRTITFNVNVTDVWGNDNPRCTLSCPGHSAETSNSFTVEASGDETKTQTCTLCGETVSCTGGGYSGGDPLPNGGTTPRVPITKTESHSCAMNVTYKCDTGTFTYGGVATGATKNGGDLTNNQLYNGTATATSPTGKTITTPAPDTSLKCDGYTDGYGCTPSHKTNCAHRGTHSYMFRVVEQVDIYAYREILASKIYALGTASVTKINEPDMLYNPDSIVGANTSNINLAVNLWRAGGEYNGSNGRIYFTQFKDPTYKNGVGWTGTSVVNVDGTANYFLGDCTVTINVVCDSVAYETGNPGALDNISISNKSGSARSHWTASGSYGTTKYQNNVGDIGPASDTVNEALHVVNAWQTMNNAEYKVMSISDMLEVECGAIKQNVLAESYAVDSGSGVRLFDYGFQSANETHYRSHMSKYTSTSAVLSAMNAGVMWQPYTQMGSISDMHTFKTGYSGNITDDPLKWRNETGVGSTFMATDLADGVNPRTANGEKWGNGSVRAVQDGTVWKRYIPANMNNASGLTRIVLQTTGQTSFSDFNGYYTNFSYPYGSYNLEKLVNGSGGVIESGIIFSGMTNKDVKIEGYSYPISCPMAINSIPLRWAAYNGLYINPIEVTGKYYNMLEFSNSSTCSRCHSSAPSLHNPETNVKSRFADSYSKGTINNVVLHTPVSVERWQVIGNNYGDYDLVTNTNGIVISDGLAQDDTGEDMRISYANVPENQKDNYGVVGNSIHVWVTDFGNFKDSMGGTYPGQDNRSYGTRGINWWQEGANTRTGEIHDNAKGYTDNMNCSRWTAARLVRFSFPVSAWDKNGNVVTYPAYAYIDLSEVQANPYSGTERSVVSENPNTHALTDAPDGIWHYSDTLNDFKDGDDEFKYGLDYEFIILTSAEEQRDATVECFAIAINASSDRNLTGAEATNKNRGYRERTYAANYVAYNTRDIDIVGRIGNLALEDVGDFRFAELFKHVTDSWLIPGVVHKVDPAAPKNVLMNSADILGNECINGNSARRSHATLSATSYLIGTNYGNGKAGSWIPLPLSAALNPITEFKDQQMRMGYSSYFDIETIGNYYGINYVGDTRTFDDGPSSYEEEKNDARTYVMNITPHYYLYDLDNGRFYSIDLYAGSMGGYTKFYGGRDTGSAEHISESSLYIDLPNEMHRRNVTSLERDMTDTVTAAWGDCMRIPNMNAMRSAYVRSDYIGTSRGITLDANDLDYIGSSYMYYQQIEGSVVQGNDARAYNQLGNENMWTGTYKNTSTLSALDFEKQSQRWYFTLSLPSSTIATYAQPESASRRTQTEIVANHEKLLEEHPNSVIVVFGDIEVTGEVWTLSYDARSINGGIITIPIYPNEDVELTDEVLKAYPEPNGTPSDNTPVEEIEPEWAPLIIHDSNNTSNKDLETYGTH